MSEPQEAATVLEYIDAMCRTYHTGVSSCPCVEARAALAALSGRVTELEEQLEDDEWGHKLAEARHRAEVAESKLVLSEGTEELLRREVSGLSGRVTRAEAKAQFMEEMAERRHAERNEARARIAELEGALDDALTTVAVYAATGKLQGLVSLEERLHAALAGHPQPLEPTEGD